MNLLSIDTYLANPNHYAIQDWVVTTDYLEDVLEKDFDKQWFSYYRAKGYIEEEVPEDLIFEFHDSIQENDLWLIVSGGALCELKFTYSTVFLVAFINELDLEDEMKDELMAAFSDSNYNLFIRFHNFPRRVDLFPVSDTPIAAMLFNTLDKEEKKALQYD